MEKSINNQTLVELNGSTYEVSSAKDDLLVKVGDDKQPLFKPRVKLEKWDNEVNFSIGVIDDPNVSTTVENLNNNIIWKQGNSEAHFYPVDDGFEFETILNKKPDKNVIQFTIQTKGLIFYKQPPLTQVEIDQGAKRPENVVGSYAVYHKTKGGMNRADGKEYKTGKAFHIYRPKVKDANGSEVWGELNIDEQKGELTVTVPQGFLDKAVYPVVVDPTFGYTTIGSSLNYWTGYASGTQFTLSEDGEATTIDLYLYDEEGNGPSNFIAGVYGSTENLLGTTGQESVALNYNDWKTFTFASPVSLTAGQHRLAFRNQSGIYRAYDVATGETILDYLGTYAASMPNPMQNDSTQNERISIYLTYTAKGGTETATPNPVSATLSVVTPASSYVQVNSNTPGALSTTLTVVSPTTSFIQVETNVPDVVGLTALVITPTSTHAETYTTTHDPVSTTLSVITPTSTHAEVYGDSPDAISVTLTPVTPTSGYLEVDTTTPNAVTTTLTVITPASDYLSVLSTATDPISTTLSVITPTTSYVQIESNAPDSVGLTLTIPTQAAGYVAGNETTTNPIQLELTPITPTSSYIQAESNTPDSIGLTLSQITSTSSYIQIKSDTPDSVGTTLTPVSPVASYASVLSNSPNVIQLTLSPITPDTSYDSVLTATHDSLLLTLGVVTPESSYLSDIEVREVEPIILNVTPADITASGLYSSYPKFIMIDFKTKAMRIGGDTSTNYIKL